MGYIHYEGYAGIAHQQCIIDNHCAERCPLVIAGNPQDSAAPGGFVGFMEMFIMMVNDDVIKSCVGPKYRKFAPYLLTAFFFIFINNLMGLIPVFPGRGKCHR